MSHLSTMFHIKKNCFSYNVSNLLTCKLIYYQCTKVPWKTLFRMVEYHNQKSQFKVDCLISKHDTNQSVQQRKYLSMTQLKMSSRSKQLQALTSPMMRRIWWRLVIRSILLGWMLIHLFMFQLMVFHLPLDQRKS